MKLEMQISIFVALISAVVVNGAKFLSEKPDSLHPCKVKDSNFRSCYAKNVQVIFREWRAGVPGLKSLNTIDPLAVKSITISQDPSSAISLSLGLHGVLIHGLSDVNVHDASFDTDKLIIKMQMSVPKVKVAADYIVNGRILNLPLDGNGKTVITLDNFKFNIAMRVKIREEGNLAFTDVKNLRLEIEDIGGMQFQLDNLFNGNKALEDSAIQVISENWRYVFEVVRPGLTSAIETIMKDRFVKIFGYVPSTYFFDDFPPAA